jgi:hypothetical protein
VRNHLSTARMREQMQTDVFYWHGYTSLRLTAADRWLKATPAFNIELCEKFGLLPLEFDGERDSIFHAADREGRSTPAGTPNNGLYEFYAHLFGASLSYAF